MKVPRRVLPVRPLTPGAETVVRGHLVRVLHSIDGRAFVKNIDNGAQQWTAWLEQSELEGA